MRGLSRAVPCSPPQARSAARARGRCRCARPSRRAACCALWRLEAPEALPRRGQPDLWLLAKAPAVAPSGARALVAREMWSVPLNVLHAFVRSLEYSWAQQPCSSELRSEECVSTPEFRIRGGLPAWCGVRCEASRGFLARAALPAYRLGEVEDPRLAGAHTSRPREGGSAARVAAPSEGGRRLEPKWLRSKTHRQAAAAGLGGNLGKVHTRTVPQGDSSGPGVRRVKLGQVPTPRTPGTDGPWEPWQRGVRPHPRCGKVPSHKQAPTLGAWRIFVPPFRCVFVPSSPDQNRAAPRPHRRQEPTKTTAREQKEKRDPARGTGDVTCAPRSPWLRTAENSGETDKSGQGRQKGLGDPA